MKGGGQLQHGLPSFGPLPIGLVRLGGGWRWAVAAVSAFLLQRPLSGSISGEVVGTRSCNLLYFIKLGKFFQMTIVIFATPHSKIYFFLVPNNYLTRFSKK